MANKRPASESSFRFMTQDQEGAKAVDAKLTSSPWPSSLNALILQTLDYFKAWQKPQVKGCAFLWERPAQSLPWRGCSGSRPQCLRYTLVRSSDLWCPVHWLNWIILLQGFLVWSGWRRKNEKIWKILKRKNIIE